MNNNSKFESIYKGKYVELFFKKEEFEDFQCDINYPPYAESLLAKQRTIKEASKVEKSLAENISISKIYMPSSTASYYFTLDLSSFKNLITFKPDGCRSTLKSLPETLKKLKFFNGSINIETQSDLSIFTGFKNLEVLDLGMPWPYLDHLPAWKGSLESLKDCKNLKFLCIGHITDITGLEYLPLDSLETINLYGTPFDNLLFGDKTLDPNKLTTYSENLPEQEVIDAIGNYQQNFWASKKEEEKPKTNKGKEKATSLPKEELIFENKSHIEELSEEESFQPQELEQRIQIAKDLQEKEIELNQVKLEKDNLQTELNRIKVELKSLKKTKGKQEKTFVITKQENERKLWETTKEKEDLENKAKKEKEEMEKKIHDRDMFIKKCMLDIDLLAGRELLLKNDKNEQKKKLSNLEKELSYYKSNDEGLVGFVYFTKHYSGWNFISKKIGKYAFILLLFPLLIYIYLQWKIVNFFATKASKKEK